MLIYEFRGKCVFQTNQIFKFLLELKIHFNFEMKKNDLLKLSFRMKIFALLSSVAIAAPTLNSSLKDMYMLSMLENGNVNPFMFSLLGKNSGDSSLWKEYLELNLLTQGQIGTGNFHTANMLNKARFQIDAI